MSRWTGLITGVCCGYAAGFVWKHHNNQEVLAQQSLNPGIAALEKQQAYAAKVLERMPSALPPEFGSALELLVEEAGAVSEKLRGLQTGLTSSNENASSAFEQTLARFASWPQQLQEAIASNPPAVAPVLSVPAVAYPEKLPLENAELDQLEKDLVKQVEDRTRLAAIVDQQETAAQTLLRAEQALRRMLPNRGI